MRGDGGSIPSDHRVATLARVRVRAPGQQIRVDAFPGVVTGRRNDRHDHRELRTGDLGGRRDLVETQRVGEEQAVPELGGQAKGHRPLAADHERESRLGRPAESHRIQVHVATGHGDGLTIEQAAQSICVFAKQGHRRGDT